MKETNKKNDQSSWTIGGSFIVGLGVGFFYLKESPLVFVACLLIGLGAGLVISPIISALADQKNMKFITHEQS